MESGVNLEMEQYFKENSVEPELKHHINSPILLFSKIAWARSPPAFSILTSEKKEKDLSY